ncbi:TPA: hypothetical protein MIZ10_29795 [Klebsiella pneumoniae]|nr:Uncharacterised protein [Klebsiella pneumoniae]HBY5838959.1 hypothetical protein [Klebsiella pneumoniae]
MTTVSDFTAHIPYYLTSNQREGLIQALREFPKNTNYYLSSAYCTDSINLNVLQGDICERLNIVSFNGTESVLRPVTGLILSNSCDISLENTRRTPLRGLFAPLVSLEKYEKTLTDKGVDNEVIKQIITDIKNQNITNIIYLPEFDDIPESIVFLDDIHVIKKNELNTIISESRKIKTLSQIGFYILLFKISVHFCRFHENIQRYENSQSA